jgi:hypothetical protein
MPNGIDPRQLSKIMKGALANPFDREGSTNETIPSANLSSAEREVIAAMQDGILDPESISLNTRLTLEEVKQVLDKLKSKNKIAEVSQSQPREQVSNTTSIPNNPTSTALRNNSGISGKSSIFVPQAGKSKLRLF